MQFVIIVLFYVIHEGISKFYQVSGLTYDILGNIIFWLTVLLTASICSVPIFAVRRAEFMFTDTIINNLRRNQYQKDYKRKVLCAKLKTMTQYQRTVDKFKRIYKQNENVDIDNYADKRMKDIIDQYKSNRQHYKNNNRENLNNKNNKLIEANFNSHRYIDEKLPINRFRSNSENMLDKFYTARMIDNYPSSNLEDFNTNNNDDNKLMEISYLSDNKEMNFINLDPKPSKFNNSEEDY